MKKLIMAALTVCAMVSGVYGRTVAEMENALKDISDPKQRTEFIRGITTDEWRLLAAEQVERGKISLRKAWAMRPNAVVEIFSNNENSSGYQLAPEYDAKFAAIGWKVVPHKVARCPLCVKNWVEAYSNNFPVLIGVFKAKGSVKMADLELGERINVLAENYCNHSIWLVRDIESQKDAIVRIAPKTVKRRLRELGDTFVVGADGKNKVQEAVDQLTACLNAPKMAGMKAWIEKWCPETKWQEPKWLTDQEVQKIADDVYYGQIPFSKQTGWLLCANMGVEAYNAFVKRFNGIK